MHCEWSGDIFHPVLFHHQKKLKGYSDQNYAETCLNTSSPKKIPKEKLKIKVCEKIMRSKNYAFTSVLKMKPPS